MDKDKIIQSLLKMLQNSHTEKINMQLSLDDLTTKLNANKEEDKKDEKQDIRTVQAKKPN